ncbi:MAG: nucleoside deaminase [Gemmatimonadetes bacterium]|jgi:tRNA(adenine34) deaminase|nr:nucleoside deaminase [Gemmatimonadota bacterium]MBT7861756.1 nucleoside deaminase [Gemmatimonadota bacterium]
MECALDRARTGAAAGEVPVGAVLVRNGELLADAWNLTETRQDPRAHAEMIAIGVAADCVRSRRLQDTTLYVTLEPCAMCAGAMVLARIPRLVFGAYDPKGGACGTLRNIVQDPRLNHGCEVVGGVLQEQCAQVLHSFFAALRSGAATAL